MEGNGDADIFFNNLELPQMTKPEGHDILSDHKKSLHQGVAFNIFPLHDMAWTGIVHFFTLILNLP